MLWKIPVKTCSAECHLKQWPRNLEVSCEMGWETGTGGKGTMSMCNADSIHWGLQGMHQPPVQVELQGKTAKKVWGKN